VVAGSVTNRGTGADFTVAKLSPDGALLWQQSLDGTNSGDDDAFSVAADVRGNVAAAGLLRNRGGDVNTGADADFAVAYFDPGGTLLWQKSINGTANQSDNAFAVAVDSETVVAAGLTRNTGTD